MEQVGLHGSLYSHDDFRAVGDYIRQHEGEPMEQIYQGVADYLSERQSREVTLAAAKNMVNRGRNMGLIPLSPRQVSRKAKAKPKKRAVSEVTEATPKRAKKFDPGMTADDLFDFNVQCIYAAQDTMPVKHLSALSDFRKACEKLMGALTE